MFIRRAIFAIIFGVLILIFYFATKSSPTQVIINEKHISVDIADDDSERIRGLSGRKSLAKDHGMLFIFPTKNIQTFWMKDMRFPLDIIWISGDKVIGLSENLQPEGLNPRNFYSSSASVDKVLEINAGLVKDLDI
ncbi:DUF192 domain-containing protein, partial [Candidatus Gottesmanbacteria bacterium]|nr:DUF192 domain-containing protein [Candidatus Gottesmanbacteria bacterium]